MINVTDNTNDRLLCYVLRDHRGYVVRNVMMTEREANEKNRAYTLNRSLYRYTLIKN